MAIIRNIALGGIGVALAAAGGFFAMGRSSQRGSAPGLVNGRLAPCPDSPNCVSSEPDTPNGKRVAPLPLESWERIDARIIDMGGEITQRSPDYIAAEFTSQTFGFVDDLELRKAQDAVHVRSASRVGYSDAGVNAKRVMRLREMSGV